MSTDATSTTDGSDVTDDVVAVLNPAPDTASPAAPGLTRPLYDVPRSAWVDYVVALGAHRDHVEGAARVYDPDAVATVTETRRDWRPRPAGSVMAELVDGARRALDAGLPADEVLRDLIAKAAARADGGTLPDGDYGPAYDVQLQVRGAAVPVPALTLLELRELATRLGG